MSMMEFACNGHSNHVSKWVTLGMMQRAEQVHDIAEMLEMTMEDLSNRMEDIDEKMELLAEATEAIQEQMEEIVDIMNGAINPDALPAPEMPGINPLPF